MDEPNGYVYYMGTAPLRWTERHLFRVRLEGGSDPECVTDLNPGYHR